jgi:uncharacterized protein YjgD (DUF1641 family)
MTEEIATTAPPDIALINEKLDYLMEKFDQIDRRQREMDELRQDMIPIANHMVNLTIDELADIGTEFQVEDLIFLLKRLLRNTQTLNRMMDYLEAGMGISDEIRLMGEPVFSNIVETLDRLEQQGYFAFMTEGWGIMERVVSEFDEDDVKALGDNIVTILTTVKNMTQPEILSVANNAITAIQPAEEVEDISTFQLIRELSDPTVRRGMARLLNIVKAMADAPGDIETSKGNGAD